MTIRTNKFREVFLSKEEETKQFLFKFLAGSTLKDGTKQTSAYWENILRELLHKSTSQKNIYSHLRTLYKQENAFDNKARSYSLARTIVSEIRRFKPYKKYKSFLDIGCATGAITLELMNQLNIPRENTYGTDIDDYNITKFNFIKTTQKTENLDTIFPSSIDLITCLMSLHHIENVETTLKELNRIISPTGILIIREHDCTSKIFSYFLDIVHGLYEMSLGEKVSDTFLKDFSADYRNHQEWRKIITAAGFRFIYQTRIVPNVRAYYSIYMKKIT